MFDDPVLLYLAAWLGCLAFIFWGQREDGRGSGLVISYVLQLWLLHWLAAALYVLPWYAQPYTLGTWGLRESTIAIAGFAIGSTVLLPALLRNQREVVVESEDVGVADPKLIHTYLIVGAVCFFILQPFLQPIPTIGALASGASNLLLVALGMECWNGFRSRGTNQRMFWVWIVLSAVLPFATIAATGFLSYGFAAMLTVFAFVASFYRPRWKLVAFSVIVGYLALSLYVTYMRDRDEIRSVVWGNESYTARISTVAKTFMNFELFDPMNVEHLIRIDERLNQNIMVGMAVQYLQVHPDRFANGHTIWEALLSPIPRVVWPDKPMSAGSGEMVSEFTGRRLNTEGTSIGIGHVMEWYANFGSTGVFFGMLITGFLIGWIDRAATARLAQGDWGGFVLWWMPGLSLLQVGGSFVEGISSAFAGLAIAWLINWYRPATPLDAEPPPPSSYSPIKA